jgi:hypothetical protein
MVLIRIGGSAMSVSATTEGRKPVPSSGIASASTAIEGSVRPMLAALIAASALAPRWAKCTPAGIATADASASAASERLTCTPNAFANCAGWPAR